eukprot:CAMPEP_0184432752 /NCGR_PEP_ID=MMETSP0738-20130409/360851_1 /TAXON_ID=385413 /ORGANISM="Thalassiosira miniscula, Strain CCMP1093" /LENGTH=243 /DNA_ID=CAMNT_0026798169 /DNA_START=162 /DNA_END=890 /DNA_ORIENTATION=+
MFSLNFKSKVAASALALSFVASSAMAVTTTTTITFNDADGVISSGNPKSYTSQGYVFQPVNINGDVKCADGSCTKENQQTGLPTLTRTDGGAFDLISFYFSIIGGEGGLLNFISVEGFTGDATSGYTSTGSAIEFRLDTVLADYTTSQNVDVTFAKSATGAACSDPTDDETKVLCKNYGYTALLPANLFENVTKVVWSASGNAQGLIDDVVLSKDGGGVGFIPVPAGLPLLLTAMGLGGFMSW